MKEKIRLDASEKAAKWGEVIDLVHHGMPRLTPLQPPRSMRDLIRRAGLRDVVKMYGLFLFQMGLKGKGGILSGKFPPMLNLIYSKRDVLVPGRKQLVPTSGNAGKDLAILDPLTDDDGCVAVVNHGTHDGKVRQLKVFGAEVIVAPEGTQATDYARALAVDYPSLELQDQYADEATIEGHEPTAAHVMREAERLLKEKNIRGRGFTIATVTGTFSTAAAMLRYAKWRNAADWQIPVMGICSADGQKVPGSRTPKDIAELQHVGGFFYRPEFKNALDFGGLVKGPSLDVVYNQNAERALLDYMPLGPTTSLCEIAYCEELRKGIEAGNIDPFLNEAGEAVSFHIGVDSNHYYMWDDRFAAAYEHFQ